MVKGDRNNCVWNEKRAREREVKTLDSQGEVGVNVTLSFFMESYRKSEIRHKTCLRVKTLLKWDFFFFIFFLQCRSDWGAFILHCHAKKYEFLKCFLFCFVLFSPDALHIRCPDDSTPQSFCTHPQFPSDSGQSASAASDRDAVGRSLGDRLNLQPLLSHVESASSLRGGNKRVFYPSIRAKEIIWFPFITRQHVVL